MSFVVALAQPFFLPQTQNINTQSYCQAERCFETMLEGSVTRRKVSYSQQISTQLDTDGRRCLTCWKHCLWWSSTFLSRVMHSLLFKLSPERALKCSVIGWDKMLLFFPPQIILNWNNCRLRLRRRPSEVWFHKCFWIRSEIYNFLAPVQNWRLLCLWIYQPFTTSQSMLLLFWQLLF